MESVKLATWSAEEGVRVYTSEEGRKRLAIEETKWFELIKPRPNGEAPEIVTFTIGRRRYVTETELQRFIKQRIQQSLNEPATARREKVKASLKAMARNRERGSSVPA